MLDNKVSAIRAVQMKSHNLEARVTKAAEVDCRPVGFHAIPAPIMGGGE